MCVCACVCVCRERGVWLGLSDGTSPGSLRWVDGSEALEGEGGGRDGARLVSGNVCVSLDSTATPSSHPCTAQSVSARAPRRERV